MDNPSDEGLLDLYFAGDAAAFRAFYQRHAGRVYAYALGKGLSAEAAEEVRQEAFLKLHRSIHRYESGRPALPWFFTIVHHCVVDAIRQTQALGRVKEHWAQPPPKSDAEEDVTPALAALSAEQRQIVESRVFQDLDSYDARSLVPHSVWCALRFFTSACHAATSLTLSASLSDFSHGMAPAARSAREQSSAFANGRSP